MDTGTMLALACLLGLGVGGFMRDAVGVFLRFRRAARWRAERRMSKPHRWICAECKRTWDTSGDGFPAGVERYEGWYSPPPDQKYPAHRLDVEVAASDGRRVKTVRCGPVTYEGRKCQTLPDWPDPPEAQNVLMRTPTRGQIPPGGY